MTDPTPVAERLSRVVKTYDVRGVAGEDLTTDMVRALGAAMSDLVDGAPIVLGHDMRLSSPEFATAFADGAARRGSVVHEAGLTSTDQLYCASGTLNAAGAMITASHNPPADNGIKFCRAGARPISRDTGLTRIREDAEAYLAAGEIPVREGGRREQVDTLEDYVSTVLGLVPVPARRRLRVVVDAANAMAGLTAPAVLGRLPQLDLVPLHMELDGTFPHHRADPLDATTLVDLQDVVRTERADLGLAFDGDADRCVVVDETGTPVPPSALTALIAAREIARARAAGEHAPAVVANLVSSRHVAETIAAAGGRHLRSPVGHSLIKALMAEENAVFGGEHSAHYYFRDFLFADSGMLAALHVLAALAEGDAPLSALVAQHSPYAASGEVNSHLQDPAAARARVRLAVRDIPGAIVDELDGMTVTHWEKGTDPAEQWWFSVRSSNTEPLLRLNVEAAEEATMTTVRDTLLAIIRGESPERPLPGSGRSVTDPEDIRPARATAAGAAGTVPTGGAVLPSWLREILCCPACRGTLEEGQAAMRCTSCQATYDVVDGIPVLIPGR
ncbi:MAG: phosphomannomutase/phosphoglucomutase [Brachybacterium sp.]|nr:phosphomannomutase/phosphoglucomutase [Brachybacterium sp.]